MKSGATFKSYVVLAIPIFSGAFLIYAILSVIYFGGRRESIAAHSESAILSYALASAESIIRNQNEVNVISFKNEDILKLQKAPRQELNDAHISEYAKVLDHVLRHKPKIVFVSWLAAAHPFTTEYLQPLLRVIDQHSAKDKVVMAVHFYTAGKTPTELADKYLFAEGRDCFYDINSYCTYLDDWTWMPQYVAKNFWKHPAKYHIAENLPHTNPSFILNLAEPTQLKTFSVSEFMSATSTTEGSSYFIGNDALQDVNYRHSKDLLQRTYTANFQKNSLLDGMPFHVFWASMAQMFIDQNTVAVAPQSSIFLAQLLFSVGIIWLILRIGIYTLIPFSIGLAVLLMLNSAGIRYFLVYVPVVDIIVTSIGIMTASIFFRLSYNLYQSSKQTTLAREQLALLDLKQNFLSMISHNINTPIAALKSSLDYCKGIPKIGEASSTLERIRLGMRTALGLSFLGGHLIPESTGFRQLIQNFDTEAGSLLTNLKLHHEWSSGDIEFFKFFVNPRVFRDSLTAAITFLASETHASRFEISAASDRDDPADPGCLILVIKCVSDDFELNDKFLGSLLRRYLESAQSDGLLTWSINQGTVINYLELRFQNKG